MPKDQPQTHKPKASDKPSHPIISDSMHQDTLDRVADIIELLEEVDLSAGLTTNARAGLYWIHRMLADTIKYVSKTM